MEANEVATKFIPEFLFIMIEVKNFLRNFQAVLIENE